MSYLRSAYGINRIEGESNENVCGRSGELHEGATPTLWLRSCFGVLKRLPQMSQREGRSSLWIL